MLNRLLSKISGEQTTTS